MQQPPGQQAPPPQQPASLDEIKVALVSAIIAAIKRKYFIIPPVEFRESLGCANAPSQSVWEIRHAAAELVAVRVERKESRCQCKPGSR